MVILIVYTPVPNVGAGLGRNGMSFRDTSIICCFAFGHEEKVERCFTLAYTMSRKEGRLRRRIRQPIEDALCSEHIHMT